jgi:hypothetical protein
VVVQPHEEGRQVFEVGMLRDVAVKFELSNHRQQRIVMQEMETKAN